jgi:hypothetical protein
MGPNGFVLLGNSKGIDAKKLLVDHEALFRWLRSVMERDDVVFEEVYWASEFRCVGVTLPVCCTGMLGICVTVFVDRISGWPIGLARGGYLL